MKLLPAILVITVITLVSGFAPGCGATQPPGIAAPAEDKYRNAVLAGSPGQEVGVGNPAPDFSWEGGSLSGMRGRVVLVNFWATWCPPCREEMPAIAKVYDKRKDFEVVAVDIQENPELVSKFFKEMEVDVPSVIDKSGDIQRAYRVRGIPASFFIAKDGTIAEPFYGAMSEAYIDRTVERLVKQ